MLLLGINIVLALGLALIGLVATSSNASAYRPADLAIGYGLVGAAAALALASVFGGPRLRLLAFALLALPYVGFALWIGWTSLGKQR